MNKIDFINIRGQQSFLENSMNSIKIRIENDMVKNMTEKYKKILANFTLEGLLFSSSVQTTPKNFLLQLLLCYMQNIASYTEKSTRLLE